MPYHTILYHTVHYHAMLGAKCWSPQLRRVPIPPLNDRVALKQIWSIYLVGLITGYSRLQKVPYEAPDRLGIQLLQRLHAAVCHMHRSQNYDILKGQTNRKIGATYQILLQSQYSIWTTDPVRSLRMVIPLRRQLHGASGSSQGPGPPPKSPRIRKQ